MSNKVLDASDVLGHRILYCLFCEKQVDRILSMTEFDALFEGHTGLDGMFGNVYVAYVEVNAYAHVQAMVLFQLPLDGQGYCVESLPIPLQRLADSAARGPNLGQGRIRLACQSQCAISRYKSCLWDPMPSTFSSVKKAVAEYFKSEVSSAVSSNRVKNEKHNPNTSTDADIDTDTNTSPSGNAASHHKKNREDGNNHRVSDELALLRRELRNESAAYRNQLQVLQQELERQRLLNERLMGDEDSEPVKGDSRLDLHVLRQQNQQLNMKVRELQLSLEKLREKNPPILTSTPEQDDVFGDPEFIVNKMAQNDVMSVVFHRGAGHINLKPNQLVDYLEDPDAYVAHHLSLNKEHYLLWLQHEKNPKCTVCDDDIVLVADPSIFDAEMDIYCDQHKPLDPE